MDATTILIALLVGGVLLYLFNGSFRRRTPSEIEEKGASGNGGGGCCGGDSRAGRSSHKKKVDVEEWIDPVCGMPVETRHAAATKRYKGSSFYFCSQQCRAAFARNPRKYIKKEELDRQPVRSGGGHGCCG